jgi:hypothetical protein
LNPPGLAQVELVTIGGTRVDAKSRQSRVEIVSSKYFDELVTLTETDAVRNNDNNMFPCGRSQ